MLTFFEFEFEYFGNIYFFPLFIDCADMDEAEIIKTSFLSGIGERYKIIRHAGPIIITAHFKSEYLEEYKKQMVNGKMIVLNIRRWQFKDFEPNVSVGFEKNLALVPYYETFDSSKIIAEAVEFKMPVQILHKCVALMNFF